jgi:Domain of unknown function (DUF4360)
MKKHFDSITVVSSILSGVILASIATTANADVVTFHPESAIYAGSGCPQGKTHILVDEMGDLLIEHEELVLDLRQGTSVLAGRKSCSIRVPVTLPQGFYVRSIQQQIQYSVMKSVGAEAKISTRTALSGDSINPFTVVLPSEDEIYGDNMIDSRRDYLGSSHRRQQYCSGTRSEEMMLQINTVISGQKESSDRDLVVAAYGGYVGEGIELEIAACP